MHAVNGSSPPPALELQLAPSSSAFPTSDQRWQNQVAQLLNDLRRNAGEVRKEITPVPGQKGGAEAIILALGTSGALTATVAIFKAWLGRATDRAIRMKAKVGDRTVEIELSGSNISEATLRAALGLAKDS